MKETTHQLDIGGKTLTASFTDLTEQANGSVLLSYGETTILVTAVMSDRPAAMPYFPLSVEFEEKFYAAGQILGSRFMRREGRPSDEAILSARIIDRTIRPLFDHRLRHEIQIVINVLAVGEDDPDVLGVIGASLALSVSDIPWAGPVAAIRLGKTPTSSDFMINPNYQERDDDALELEMITCGQNGTINMIETAGQEVSDALVLDALAASIPLHKDIEAWQQKIIAAHAVPKRDIEFPEVPQTVVDLFTNQFQQKLYETIFSQQTGKRHLQACQEEFVAAVVAAELTNDTALVSGYFAQKLDDLLHEGVCTHGQRADGRAFDEVRPLYAKAGGISPVLHGVGTFYRGGTHILTALTLGGPNEAQLIDTIESQDTKKHFLHHYNFPPFSVGETGRVGGFNRRMIGHGALAEKALTPVIPDQEKFPYTIRLVSETLAANGSSSMGSVCASTLALLDGGVPITRPVAGIASGVMIMGETYQLLTDIQGPEDEHGDMDFKVAGTREGITAIQMDVKVAGVSLEILEGALAAAHAARMTVLDTIEAEIATPRDTISPRAPEIVVITINPDQIGLVIGSSGKTINAIKEASGTDDITIEDDGTIYITGKNGTASAAKERIQSLTRVFTIGETTTATITKITDFGAFARLPNEQEGLIHISEIATFRIEEVSDVLTAGQTVPVMITKIEHGKIGLSIKQADETFITTPRSEQS